MVMSTSSVECVKQVIKYANAGACLDRILEDGLSDTHAPVRRFCCEYATQILEDATGNRAAGEGTEGGAVIIAPLEPTKKKGAHKRSKSSGRTLKKRGRSQIPVAISSGSSSVKGPSRSKSRARSAGKKRKSKRGADHMIDEDHLNKIMALIKSGVADSDQRVRKAARTLYDTFSEMFPLYAPQVYNAFSPSNKRRFMPGSSFSSRRSSVTSTISTKSTPF